MAIGPKTLQTKFNSEVESLESFIDHKLSQTQIQEGGHVYVTLRQDITQAHVNALVTKYEAAGWTRVHLIARAKLCFQS